MLEKIESKFYKYSISNLIRYIIFILVIGFCLNIIDSSIYPTYLSLDFEKIGQGQVWRLISFIFYNNSSSSSFFSIILFFFSLLFYYFIGNGLEMIWGKFWFNMYIFSGIIFNILGSFIIYLCTGESTSSGLNYILQSMFLAFAVLFPEMKVNFYFIFPIKIRWLGIIYGAIIIIQAISYFMLGNILGISIGISIVISLLNFVLYILLTKKRQKKQNQKLKFMFDRILEVQKRILEEESNLKKEDSSHISKNNKIKPKYVHKCCICGKTELDDSNLEFRYCSKCNGEHEYCSDHIFNHEHIKED